MTKPLRKPDRRGALTVEMAIAVPVLFLLVFAALEFCGANIQRHTADNAAYEAARRGIVPGATAQDVRAEAQTIMAFVGARNVTVDVNPSTITDLTEELSVRVEVPLGSNGWLAPMFFDTSDLIVGECTMRREEF